MACEFVIPTALPPCPLGSDARHNIFLATKDGAVVHAMVHVAEDFVWVKRPQAQGADQKLEKAVWFTSGRKASRRVTPEY